MHGVTAYIFGLWYFRTSVCKRSTTYTNATTVPPLLPTWTSSSVHISLSCKSSESFLPSRRGKWRSLYSMIQSLSQCSSTCPALSWWCCFCAHFCWMDTSMPGLRSTVVGSLSWQLLSYCWCLSQRYKVAVCPLGFCSLLIHATCYQEHMSCQRRRRSVQLYKTSTCILLKVKSNGNSKGSFICPVIEIFPLILFNKWANKTPFGVTITPHFHHCMLSNSFITIHKA